ncbi:DUF4872 domain-containing protein [Dactylosporangium aurantiacum]|uniref:DUF4872 domain-containing protein n=1 Tax=Dactylosporangium aurantiacum TaxID=35754 RepID=A0A9Q9IJH1_9ACTN|nr:DUF4872 domain-containing protein [Dactylosporangium aurantiacum]MDG6109964.1 DUF4872 domain-containing protein [Dactylosporangium aurantiacum]UWZ57284.1 DUF4872 domain-containing protein [Dactylosporangium aurantiacum]
MTDHKHLKRLVRARSARTGESYTTARRHVLATAPGAVDVPVSPGAVDVPVSPGAAVPLVRHQPSDVVRRLLHAAGTELSEPMVCGLGGGIGFMTAVFEYRGRPPILTLVAQHHPAPWAPTVLRRLGIAFAESHSTTPAAALQALRARLADGLPVYCTVAAGRLPWRTRTDSGPGAATTFTDADPHGVLVTAEDPGGVTVHDAGPHRLPVEAFADAWSAHRKGRHHRLVVTGATPSTDLATAVTAAVEETAAHLTGPVLGTAFDANFGFAGMTRLAAQLRDTTTRTGFARRFAAPDAYAFLLRRVHECLEEQHTAPGATRPIYADFLDEAAGLTGRPRLAEAATALRASGAVWSAMAATARESAGSAPAAVFAALADLLDEARVIEEAAVGLLRP